MSPLDGADNKVAADTNRASSAYVPLLQRAVAVEIEREWVRPLAQDARVSGVVPLGYGSRHSPQLA